MCIDGHFQLLLKLVEVVPITCNTVWCSYQKPSETISLGNANLLTQQNLPGKSPCQIVFHKSSSNFLLDSSESAVLKAIPFSSLKCVRIYIYTFMCMCTCVYILIYSIYRQSTALGALLFLPPSFFQYPCSKILTSFNVIVCKSMLFWRHSESGILTHSVERTWKNLYPCLNSKLLSQ